MSQQFHFKFLLQHIEFTHKADLSTCELSIWLKKSVNKQHVATLQVKNPERTLNLYRIPIEQTVEMQQKLQLRDGEFSDHNIKFLFYIQGNQLVGDCVFNLAYYLNVPDQKIKKQLTSTNDKRATLYLKIVYSENELTPLDVSDPHITYRGQNSIQTAMPQSTRNSHTNNRSPKVVKRVRSQSPPPAMQDANKERLTMKFQELDTKFVQQKQQQKQQNEDSDEIEAIISKQEEELESQLSQIDTQIESLKIQTSEGMFRRSQDRILSWEDKLDNLNMQMNEQQQELKEYQKQNEHFKVIIRQQSETIAKLTQEAQQSCQCNNSNSNQQFVQQLQPHQSQSVVIPQQSQIQSQQLDHYEKIIAKKNQTIQELSNQLLELESTQNSSMVEQYRIQIRRLEQIVDEQATTMRNQEKIYQEKIYKLLQRD